MKLDWETLILLKIINFKKTIFVALIILDENSKRHRF